MFKNLFKGVKKALQNPIVQLGIGALVPGMAAGMAPGLMRSVLTNPALLQGGIGLLSGDKPTNVLRNLAYGTALGGISNLGQPGGFMGGAKNYLGMGQQPEVIAGAATKQPVKYQDVNLTGDKGLNMGELGYDKALIEQAKVEGPGFLEKYGLVNKGEDLNFFEKYEPLLKIGTVGLSIAAAALGEDAAKDLYDPNKNPYLTGNTKISDVYTPLEYNRGGIGSYAKGGMDNLRKNGMVYGPGGPKEDLIDAKLSNGEFVFTAAAVDKAGGPRAMYSLMNKLDPNSETYMESRGGIARV